MTETAPRRTRKSKLAPPRKNRIAAQIDLLVGQANNPTLRDTYKAQVLEILPMGMRYTYILNNRVEVTVSELATFAQVLQTTMEQLLEQPAEK